MLRGEVWWVDFDPSLGGEIQKTRPAVIVSNDASNRNLNRVQVIPITSSVARVYPGDSDILRSECVTREAPFASSPLLGALCVKNRILSSKPMYAERTDTLELRIPRKRLAIIC